MAGPEFSYLGHNRCYYRPFSYGVLRLPPLDEPYGKVGPATRTVIHDSQFYATTIQNTACGEQRRVQPLPPFPIQAGGLQCFLAAISQEGRVLRPAKSSFGLAFVMSRHVRLEPSK